MAKLNVCHCLISGGFGGIERQVFSLANTQRKRSRVGVIFAMAGGPFADEIRQLDGVSTLVLGLRSGMSLHPGAVRRVSRFMADFDVVHLHSFNYVLLLAAALARKDIVFTFHGLTHLRRELSVRDRLKFASLKYCADHVFSQVTTVSSFMRDKVSEALNLRKKLHVVPNSTPEMPESFADKEPLRRMMGACDNDLLVITYGRLVHNKRVDLLLDTANLLKKNQVENVKYAIIGDGPQKQELKNRADELGLASEVAFLPFTQDIYDYVHAADLCVFPSKQESFGIVALEAMAIGKILIVLQDGGGLAEVVGPVRDGAFVAADMPDMAGKIEFIARNRAVLRDTVEFRQQSAAFGAVEIADRYRDVYSGAVNEKN